MKKAMLKAVDQVIVLIDSSKFGVKSFTRVIGPDNLDSIDPTLVAGMGLEPMITSL